jgi:hypothetical protein
MIAAVQERKERDYLEGLAARLKMWRLREGKSYFSMPSALWDEAVAVARKIGLTRAARQLGLNREDLQRRMGLAPPAEAPRAAAFPAASEEAPFIELPGVAQALTSTASPATFVVPEGNEDAVPTPFNGGPDDAVVEIHAVDGARLTVRVPVAHLNIHTLIQEFRGGTCSR